MQHCHQCHPFGQGGLGPALNDKPAPRFLVKTQVRLGFGTMPGFSKNQSRRPGPSARLRHGPAQSGLITAERSQPVAAEVMRRTSRFESTLPLKGNSYLFCYLFFMRFSQQKPRKRRDVTLLPFPKGFPAEGFLLMLLLLIPLRMNLPNINSGSSRRQEAHYCPDFLVLFGLIWCCLVLFGPKKLL